MRRKKDRQQLKKSLYTLLWNGRHWLFVTEEPEAVERLLQLAETPEVRQWGGQLEGFCVENPTCGIHGIFVGGIPKVLLPPQVMGRLLDRVHIDYTSRWLAGLAPILFVCREIPRAEVLMSALASFIGDTRFQWTGDVARSE